MEQEKKKIIVNEVLLNDLLDKINTCIKSDIEEEQPFKYPYILGFSEALNILKINYNIEIEIDKIDNSFYDKMIAEIISNLQN